MARIEQSVEVHMAPEAVYECLLRFEEYPSFMQDVRQVRRIGAQGLQWEVGHGERARSWQAEITEQIPGRRLAWRHVHGPRHEASFELSALSKVGAEGEARALTRLTLVLDCESPEQGFAQPADAVRALQARTALDLARLRKHIEQHNRSGVFSVRETLSEVNDEYVDTSSATFGRTISVGDAAGEASAAASGLHEQRTMSWKRRAPTLPELWDLWQQPLRMARRVSHEVERVVDSVRGRGGTRLLTKGVTGTASDAARSGAWSPAVETAQRARKFVVCAELPGLKCEDVQVEIKHDRVTISGERHAEPVHEPHEERHSERRYGPFYRVILLPPGALPEQAAAQMRDGVLEITVPLAEYATRPRRLDVRPAQGLPGL